MIKDDIVGGTCLAIDWIPGDAGDNGVVDIRDFIALARNFGLANSADGAVPEPVTLALMLVGSAVFCRVRRDAPIHSKQKK